MVERPHGARSLLYCSFAGEASVRGVVGEERLHSFVKAAIPLTLGMLKIVNDNRVAAVYIFLPPVQERGEHPRRPSF